jgi:hypothetical protein
MRAHFSLPSVEGDDAEGKVPINVKFEIPYFTTSGLQVRKTIRTFKEGKGKEENISYFSWALKPRIAL